MRVAVFSAKNYERTLLDELNAGHRHELIYFDTSLGHALREKRSYSLEAKKAGDSTGVSALTSSLGLLFIANSLAAAVSSAGGGVVA